ncbi:MAG: prolipoprotein diacylglyceryl transferase [Erysipelotrichia bacterium]|nr:prolipoprotein diacylglyceryl transferase [Erysipelotrichia bacterium]
MEFFPEMAVFLKIGSIEIRWYAVCILTGALLAYYLSNKEALADKYNSGVLDDIFIGCMFFGILGARLWYCLFYNWSSYIARPLSIIEIWDGGLAIQGGLIAGAIFALIYCKIEHYQFWHLADIVMPNVLLAQACGRWGNYFNQEAYGNIVRESYFDGILSFLKQGMYIDFEYRQPMFFYESLLCLIGFILIKIYRKSDKSRRGDGVFAYFAWYGAIRFWIETQRSDSLMLGNLKMAMIVSVVFMLIGIPGLLGAFKKFINREKPAVIFDLDGTLLDTQQAIYESFRYTFAQYCPDLQLNDQDYAGFLGPTLKESFEKYCPQADPQQIEEMIKTYKKHNTQVHADLVKAMPHVKVLLDYLKENKYKIAIASSKTTETVKLGLQVSGLTDYFTTIVGVEQVYQPKPDKEILEKTLKEIKGEFTNAVYVGDSPTDIMCAKNAGVYSVGLTSNKLKVDELKAAGPNELIDDMGQMIELLQKDHCWSFNLK